MRTERRVVASNVCPVQEVPTLTEYRICRLSGPGVTVQAETIINCETDHGALSTALGMRTLDSGVMIRCEGRLVAYVPPLRSAAGQGSVPLEGNGWVNRGVNELSETA
jgi:hypothetical protein